LKTSLSRDGEVFLIFKITGNRHPKCLSERAVLVSAGGCTLGSD
jgi:hypothetical protein